MSKSEWQVGPVLKAKLNSQGTLFRGGTKYSSDARYPRGYTPERQAAVRETVKPAGWSVTDPQHAAQQRREIADTLARSTVPLPHLQSLQWAHVSPGESITPGDTAAGAYFKGTPGMIGVKPEYTRTPTVIHEVGHHVSHTMGTEHARNYSYETEHGGAEEAFADNYAEEHYRDRKGRQEQRGTYGGGKYAGRIERSDEFWSSYHQHRDNSLYNADVAKQNADYFRRHPDEVVHPDNTVDVPLVEKYVDYHGKATTGLNTDALPEWSHKYHV